MALPVQQGIQRIQHHTAINVAITAAMAMPTIAPVERSIDRSIQTTMNNIIDRYPFNTTRQLISLINSKQPIVNQ